jgi:uncharacterized protein
MQKIILSGLVLLIFFAGVSFGQEPDIPGRTDEWVNDYADIIDVRQEKYIEDLIDGIEQRTKDPIEVIVGTFDSTAPIGVDRFAYRYAENWRASKRKERDNGVVIFVSMEDKIVTIGVGDNLKDIITDDIVEKIINKDIMPSFRRGAYGDGIRLGVQTLVNILERANIPQGMRIIDYIVMLTYIILIAGICIWAYYFFKKHKK